MSTKPAPWTLSPQLTEAPELWRGCIAYWPLWENVGKSVMNLVTRKRDPFVNDGGVDPTWRAEKFGALVRFNSVDSSYIAITESSPFRPAHFTYWAYIRVFGTDDAKIIYAKEIGGPWNKMNLQGNEKLRGTVSAGGSTVDVDASTGFGGFLATVSVSYDGNVVRVFVNGVQEGSDSSLSGDADWTNALPRIGRRSSDELAEGNPDYYDGDIYIVSLWNRALTDTEQKFLARDPFAMLRPQGL